MKRKFLYGVVLAALLITGCSSAPMPLTYDDTTVGLQNGLVNQANLDTADLFAKDLCVIPKGSDTSKDSKLTGISTLLVDTTDDSVLYADNVYEKIYPASITKLATALVVYKYADLNQTLTVSKAAAGITEQGAKLCGIKEGEKIIVKDLLTALLVYSGNDAGIALADHVAGNEKAFADMMNEEVKKLGAVHSNFENAHGLHDEKHYTTAYDIYLIFNELLKYDGFLDIINLGEYKMNFTDALGNQSSKIFSSSDRYLTGQAQSPEGITVLGGKTGTTNKAGSCLVLASKDKQQHTYVSLILKSQSSDSLFSQMSYLLSLAVK